MEKSNEQEHDKQYASTTSGADGKCMIKEIILCYTCDVLHAPEQNEDIRPALWPRVLGVCLTIQTCTLNIDKELRAIVKNIVT